MNTSRAILVAVGAIALQANSVIGANQAVNDDNNFYLHWLILDKEGERVPNADVGVTTSDKDGGNMGEIYRSGIRVGPDGIGEFGMGGQLPNPTGWISVVAEHPAIGRVVKTIPWIEAHRGHRGGVSVVIRATAGLGLREARESAARDAPLLVARLLVADEAEAEKIQGVLVRGEAASLPAILAALKDYENPQRRRLVSALMAVWDYAANMVDEKTRKELSPITSMHYSRVYFLVGGERGDKHFNRRRIVETLSLSELRWAIKDVEFELLTIHDNRAGRRQELLGELKTLLVEVEGIH